MTCCEPVAVRSENRYGVINATLHAPDCPYGAGLPFRGDLTPSSPRPELPKTYSMNAAVAHWQDTPVGHDCDVCRYVDAHLDDDDDHRESIADTSPDEVVGS